MFGGGWHSLEWLAASGDVAVLTIRQIFKPVYRGKYAEVRPKHWWSISNRRFCRRTVLPVAEYAMKEAAPYAVEMMVDRSLYGWNVIDPDGRRIDPRKLEPPSLLGRDSLSSRADTSSP